MKTTLPLVIALVALAATNLIHMRQRDTAIQLAQQWQTNFVNLEKVALDLQAHILQLTKVASDAQSATRNSNAAAERAILGWERELEKHEATKRERLWLPPTTNAPATSSWGHVAAPPVIHTAIPRVLTNATTGEVIMTWPNGTYTSYRLHHKQLEVMAGPPLYVTNGIWIEELQGPPIPPDWLIATFSDGTVSILTNTLPLTPPSNVRVKAQEGPQ